MDSEFSYVDILDIALFLKNIIQVVDNIEPWESRVGDCYFLNFKGHASICVTVDRFKLIVKFLKFIDYKLNIVDNKLKIERIETKAIKDNKNRRKGNGAKGSACDDSTIQ